MVTKEPRRWPVGSLRLSTDFSLVITFYRSIQDCIDRKPPLESGNLLYTSVNRFVDACINNHHCEGVVYINADYIGEIETVKETLLDRLRREKIKSLY